MASPIDAMEVQFHMHVIVIRTQNHVIVNSVLPPYVHSLDHGSPEQLLPVTLAPDVMRSAADVCFTWIDAHHPFNSWFATRERLRH
jgi:hypothetical protein